MQFKKVSRHPIVRPFLQAMVLSGCIALGSSYFQAPGAFAQTGLTIFSGVERGQELSHSFDFGNSANQTSRYYLKLRKKNMKIAVSQFVISHPDYFDGEFDLEEVEITVNGKKVAIDEAKWDKDNARLEIYPKESIPAKTDVQIILSNVTNPDVGVYYFNCLAKAPGDVPVLRDLGTWIISIDP